MSIITAEERSSFIDIMAQIGEAIESGTSLTMGDLNEEAADLVRRVCAADGEELPLPDLSTL